MNAASIRDALAQVRRAGGAADHRRIDSRRAGSRYRAVDRAAHCRRQRARGAGVRRAQTGHLRRCAVVAADLSASATAHRARAPPCRPTRLRTRNQARAVDLPDGQVLDSGRRIWHAPPARPRSAQTCDGQLGGSWDRSIRPNARQMRGDGARRPLRHPIRSTGARAGRGIVHDESATRSTVFVEPPEIIELGNELRAADPPSCGSAARAARAHRPVAPASRRDRRGGEGASRSTTCAPGALRDLTGSCRRLVGISK